MWNYNDGVEESNIVQNRFTAYLKVSLEHNTARYEAKLLQKSLVEMAYSEDEDEFGEYYRPDPFEQITADEFGDARLRQGLSSLRDVERAVLISHVLQDKPLKKIAVEMEVPYPTVKSHYRRAIEKLRKELNENEF